MIYKFNANDAKKTYGLVFRTGTYEELLKAPKTKGGYAKSWEDEHGTERDLSQIYFETRELALPVTLRASNETEFYTRYNALTNFLLTSGYFFFDVVAMNRRFKLLYKEMTPFDKLTMIKGNTSIGADFTITLYDDFPHVNETIPA